MKLYNVTNFHHILLSGFIIIMSQKPWYGTKGMILHNIRIDILGIR